MPARTRAKVAEMAACSVATGPTEIIPLSIGTCGGR